MEKTPEVGIFIEDIHGNEFVNFDLFIKGKGRNVIDHFDAQARMSHNVLENMGVNTKRPFRKFYEPTPEGKRQKKEDELNALLLMKHTKRVEKSKPTKQTAVANPTLAADDTEDIAF